MLCYEMFKQFILPGFNSGGLLYFFHKRYFFKLHSRKLHNKIHDGALQEASWILL